MWLLPFIPDFFVHIIAIVGILLTVGAIAFGQIPFIGTYNIPINIIGVVLIILGFYLEGGISDNEKWQAKVSAMQIQAAQNETKAAEATNTVVTKYITKIEKVKEKGDVVIKEIPKYITPSADAQCVVPNSFVLLHDSASQNEIPDTSRAVDERASKVKLSGVTETVVKNYNTYYQLSEQLKALQEWVKEQQRIQNGD